MPSQTGMTSLTTNIKKLPDHWITHETRLRVQVYFKWGPQKMAVDEK